MLQVRFAAHSWTAQTFIQRQMRQHSGESGQPSQAFIDTIKAAVEKYYTPDELHQLGDSGRTVALVRRITDIRPDLKDFTHPTSKAYVDNDENKPVTAKGEHLFGLSNDCNRSVLVAEKRLKPQLDESLPAREEDNPDPARYLIHELGHQEDALYVPNKIGRLTDMWDFYQRFRDDLTGLSEPEKKTLAKTLRVQPSSLVEITNQCLREAFAIGREIIKLGPSDYRKHAERLKQTLEFIQHWCTP